MSGEYQDVERGITIYQHGLDVCSKFDNLITGLQTGVFKSCHPLPKWFFDYKEVLLPIINEREQEIRSYLVYHDCGKPLCLSVDELGRRRFHNHSEISRKVFLKHSNNYFIADLIGKDMLCHTTKPKDYMDLLNEKNIEILLFSALAEIHSNAEMFGGFGSDNFKIKFKNLEKLGSRILAKKYGVVSKEVCVLEECI